MDVVDRRGEIGALHQVHPLVRTLLVFGAVVRVHGVVDALRCLLGVQFAQVSVLVAPIVVVDAVGDITCLLDLGQERARADGMDAAGRQEEHIVFLHLVFCQRIADAVFGHHLFIALRRELPGESAVERGMRFRLHHIPHFRFPAGLSVAMSNLVGRMHLDGEVALRIDELDEQREAVSEAQVVFASHELITQAVYKLRQRNTLVGPFGHDALAAWHGTNFPALANEVALLLCVFELSNLTPTPDGFFQYGFKFEYIHYLALLFIVLSNKFW